MIPRLLPVRRLRGPQLLVAALLAATSVAQAAMPVIDVASIAQLVTQVRTLQAQLVTAQNHLLQAQAELKSMTGGRGMQQLLAGTVRNYLPADWQQLTDAVANTSVAYAALGQTLQAALANNAVLDPVALAALAPADQAAIGATRRVVAMQQVVSRQALSNAGARFAAIQQLIDAIGAAGDQKAILDLQARISAEGGMLQNEQIKLQLLQQAAGAEQASNAAQLQEAALAGQGHFETRFRPVAN